MAEKHVNLEQSAVNRPAMQFQRINGDEITAVHLRKYVKENWTALIDIDERNFQENGLDAR